MKIKVTILFMLLAALFLVACNSNVTNETAVTEMQVASQIQSNVGSPQLSTNHETMTDEQGAVRVSVTPLNLDETDKENLAFEVAMDTHSVDLSMDLATLGTEIK